MALIDNYIETQYEFKSVQAMAQELGLSENIIRSKMHKLGLEIRGNFAYSRRQEAEEHLDEYTALLHFIQERKEGIWVDIAKRRLQDIEHKVKQLTL